MRRRRVLKELEERIGKLEERKEYIGEYWIDSWSTLFSCYFAGWHRFTKEDIEDEVDGYVKLQTIQYLTPKWLDRKYIFFYKDVYDPMKKKMAKKWNNYG